MISLIKNNIRLFLKNKYLSLGFIAFFAIINTYLTEMKGCINCVNS